MISRTIDDSLRDEVGETMQNLKVALEDDRELVAQGLMTIDEFNQEWYNSFEAAIKGAYYAREVTQARLENRIKRVPYDPAVRVHCVWDLGTGQQLAVGFYQAVGRERHMIDFWQGSNQDGIPQAIKALQAKPYVYGTMFVPNDAKATEQSTGRTRLQTAQRLWSSVNWQVIPMLGVDAGIQQGKLFWATLWVNAPDEPTADQSDVLRKPEGCELFMDYIVQYRQKWDENRGMFLNEPFHDFTSHAADVHRYAAIVEELMTNDNEEPMPVQEEPNEDVYD